VIDADPFELRVPADPSGLSTVRVFLRAVARAADATPERADDLELIVSEISAALVEGGSGWVTVTVRPGPERLDVDVRGDAAPPAPEDNQIRGDLLASLAPDTTWADHGARFSLSLDMPEEGGAAAQAR
jgi:anti-sigma regulatory factor (Ser/Thr protein kinase)